MDPFGENNFGEMGEGTAPEEFQPEQPLEAQPEGEYIQPEDEVAQPEAQEATPDYGGFGMDMGGMGGDNGMGMDMGGMGGMGGDSGMGMDMGGMGADSGMGMDMGGDNGMGMDMGMGGADQQGDFGMDMGDMGADSGMGMDMGMDSNPGDFGMMTSDPQQSSFGMDDFDAPPSQAAPSFDAPPAVAQRSHGEEDDYSVIRNWNAQWRDKIAAKDALHGQKKTEIMNQAREQLNKYYDMRQKSLLQKKQTNRDQESELLLSLEQDKNLDNPWKRVVKMVDLGTDLDKTKKDVSRFKSILIKLKDKPLSLSRQVNVRS